MAFLSYQRRQTFIIASVCIIIVIGTLIYVYGPSWNESREQNTPIKGSLEVNSNTIGDLANGDWKKTFFAVSSSTDSAYKTESAASSSVPEVLTQTDMLGREFFAAYAQLRQSGLTSDTNAINSAANLVVSNAVARIPSPAVYETKDLKILEANDVNTLTAYSSKLSSILGTNFPKTNETVIVGEALDADDMSILKGIDPIISDYQATLKALVTMNVPKSLATYHVSLLNGVSLQIFNAQALRNLETDPVRGLAAINMEIPAMETITGALEKIAAYLKTKGISFTY